MTSTTRIDPKDFDYGDSVVVKDLFTGEDLSGYVDTPTLTGVIVRARRNGRAAPIVLQLDGISSGGTYRLVSHTKVKP